MRWISVVAAVMTMAVGGTVWAQSSGGETRGLFGNRSLGGTLQPKPRTLVNGLLTGPSGDFVGRGRAAGLTFNPSVWQATSAQLQQSEWRNRLRDNQQAAVEATPRAANQAAQVLPSFPEAMQPTPQAPVERPVEQWFRSPPPATARAAASAEQTALSGVGGEAAAGPSIPALPRVTVQVGFSVPAGSPGPGPFLTALLARTPRIARVSPISVTMESDTAVLRGQVRTLRDRQLAEDLVRLEPGVWEVRNELVVAEPQRP